LTVQRELMGVWVYTLKRQCFYFFILFLIFLMRLLRYWTNISVLREIYYALINSYIKYGILVWGNASESLFLLWLLRRMVLLSLTWFPYIANWIFSTVIKLFYMKGGNLSSKKIFFLQNNTAIISPYYPAAHDRYRIVWNRMFSYPYYSFSYIWISLAIIIALYYRIHIWFNNYLMYLLLYLLPFLFYFSFRTWYFWWHCRPYRQFSFFHYDHTFWLSFFVHLFCRMCMNKNITNWNCDAH